VFYCWSRSAAFMPVNVLQEKTHYKSCVVLLCCCVVLCCVVLCCVVLCRVMSCHAVLCCVSCAVFCTSYIATLCTLFVFSVLCFVLRNCVVYMFCRVVLCCVVLCCVVFTCHFALTDNDNSCYCRSFHHPILKIHPVLQKSARSPWQCRE
jgi:hypothetical protein